MQLITLRSPFNLEVVVQLKFAVQSGSVGSSLSSSLKLNFVNLPCVLAMLIPCSYSCFIFDSPRTEEIPGTFALTKIPSTQMQIHASIIRQIRFTMKVPTLFADMQGT